MTTTANPAPPPATAAWKTGATALPFKQDTAPAAQAPAALLGVALLAVAAWLWLRRAGKPHGVAARGQLARVVESHRLGPRSTIAVVEFAGQRHLVAQTEHAVTCIAQVPIDGHAGAGERA